MIITAIFVLILVLFVLEIIGIWKYRVAIKNVERIASELHLEDDEQREYMNSLISSAKGIFLPIRLLFLPIILTLSFIFKYPRIVISKKSISLSDTIQKNNKDLFPVFREEMHQAVVWSSPTARLLLGAQIGILFSILWVSGKASGTFATLISDYDTVINSTVS